MAANKQASKTAKNSQKKKQVGAMEEKLWIVRKNIGNPFRIITHPKQTRNKLWKITRMMDTRTQILQIEKKKNC